MKKKKIHSLNKGKRGEREVAKILTEAGFPARRGQQFSGSPDSPDVVCENLKGIHFEVKNTERVNLYDWLAQAAKDADEQWPIVIHRKKGKHWVAILDFDLLLRFFNVINYHIPGYLN